MQLNRLALAAGLIALALVAGCGERENLRYEDNRNPYFAKAEAQASAHGYQMAAEAYEEALRANPNLARAHYEAARIYSDQLSDSIKAMYHAKAFLDARPDSPLRAEAQALLDSEMRRFAASVPNSPQANAQAIDALRIENVRLKKALIGKLRAASVLQPPESKPLLNPHANKNEMVQEANQLVAEKAATERRASTTHTIASGDSLWEISKKYYPDDIMNGIDRIKAANPDALPEGQALKIGTTIVIP